MKPEKALTHLSVDLMEYAENQIFLERLLKLESGIWQELKDLCFGLQEVTAQIATIESTFSSKIAVTWLDYPDSLYGEGFCLVIFFLEKPLWHNIALYNKRALIMR